MVDAIVIAIHLGINAVWIVLWIKTRRERKKWEAAVREMASLADTYRLAILEIHAEDAAIALFTVHDEQIGEMRGARTFIRHTCSLLAERHDAAVQTEEL